MTFTHPLYLRTFYVDIQSARTCLAAQHTAGAFSGDMRKIRLKRMT